MKRKIIQIHEDKCVGCGLCVAACHEGAIEMVDGKAKLISDQYCDGLGDCLPACPTDAIEIIERDAAEYSQEAVDAKMAAEKKADNPFSTHSSTSHFNLESGVKAPHMGGCPGSMQRSLKQETETAKPVEKLQGSELSSELSSELRQWPVQLKLVNAGAAFLNQADILIAADCTAYAYADFHKKFMKNRVTIIGCPKLDDNQYNIDKLTEIFTKNEIRSVLVTRMEVPCCSGIVSAVKTALKNCGKIIPYAEVTLSTDGKIL